MIGKAILRWIIGILALIAILITIMLTPAGLRIGLKIAEMTLPGKMTYERSSGVITGPIELINFQYTDGKNSISIQKLKLKWNPLQLFRKKIDVEQLEANHIHLTLQKLPISIRHLQLKAHLTTKNIQIQSSSEITNPFPLKIKLNVSGNIHHYTIHARTISPNFLWRLNGTGNTKGLSLHLNEGKTLGGTLSFHSSVYWKPQWQWSVKLNGQHLNFNELDYNWPQQINIRLLTQGKIQDSLPKFTFTSQVTAPGTSIHVTGSQKSKLNIKWKLAIANLSKLYNPFQGSIQSQGEWSLNAVHPIIQGTLQINHLSALEYQGDTITAAWELYPGQHRTSSFNITAKNLRTPITQLNALSLHGSGTEHAHNLQGDMTVDANTLHFQLHGGLLNKTWGGRLQKFTIRSTQYHDWQLLKHTHIKISKDRISTEKLCLKSIGTIGQLCLDGSWDAKTAWKFKANGQQFNPAVLTRFISSKLTLSSPSSLDAIVSGKGDRLSSAKINIRLHKGTFHYRLNGNSIDSPLQTGSMNILLKQNTLSTSAQVTLSKKNTLSLSAKIPHFSLKKPSKTLQIQGKLKAQLSDLSPFSKMLKAIANPLGVLSMDLSIEGKLNTPNISGQIRFRNGSVEIPRLGIDLKKIDANISSFSATSMKFKLTAYSKNKPIHVDGETKVTPKGLQTTVSIKASNALIMNTSEYIIYATPDLKVSILGDEINLTGKVNIPQGIIQPHSFTNVTKLPSDQIVYTAGEPITKKTTWAVSANIEVSLGKKVVVNTSGFHATVTGRATIIGHPKKTTIANGQINIVEGKYSAYGKTLIISPGSYVQFINSPVNNPLFNVRATKKIEVTESLSPQQFGTRDLIVGVALRGSFHHPKILFFSIPATLSQADIISYLVLGYASQNTSTSSLSLLAEAASALGGKGGGIGGAISEIKQGLGLTELGVESQTLIDAIGTPIDQQSSFVIGKRLTKNISIRYSLGLGQGPFAPVNIFQVRYQINSHWAIQTNSSNLGSGGDILYTIETN